MANTGSQPTAVAEACAAGNEPTPNIANRCYRANDKGRTSGSKIANRGSRGYAAAGCIDYSIYRRFPGHAKEIGAGERYLNNGVLLMNLDYCRKHHITEKACRILNTRVNRWTTQDALNPSWGDNVKILPPAYNSGKG